MLCGLPCLSAAVESLSISDAGALVFGPYSANSFEGDVHRLEVALSTVLTASWLGAAAAESQMALPTVLGMVFVEGGARAFQGDEGWIRSPTKRVNIWLL